MLLIQETMDMIYFSEIKIGLLFVILLSGFCLQSCFFLDEADRPIEFETVYDEEGILRSQPPIWVVDINGGSENTVGNMSHLIVHDSIVACITSEGDKLDWYLTGISTADGSFLWKWNDLFTINQWLDVPTLLADNLGVYRYAIPDRSATTETYAVDLNTGDTKWKIQNGYPWGGASLIPFKGNLYAPYFDMTETDTARIQTVYQIDLETGRHDSITQQYLDPVSGWGRLKLFGEYLTLAPFTSDGVDYLFAPYVQRQPYDSTYGDAFMGLYDLTNKKQVYDSIPLLMRTRNFGETVLYQDRIAIMSIFERVLAIDIISGKIIWNTGLIDQGGFSLQIADGILIMGQYFGSVSYMYGKDPETGRTLWRTENGGGAEELQSHNGIVYWVDRGDAKLWALDAKTGEVLWKINDPDPESDSKFVHSKLGILPGENGEKGKLFASTVRRLYCYELIR